MLPLVPSSPLPHPLSRRHPSARYRHHAPFKTHSHLRQQAPFHLALDPITARSFHDETLPQDGAKTPHFCSIKISEDVRQYAAEQGIAGEEALAKVYVRA